MHSHFLFRSGPQLMRLVHLHSDWLLPTLINICLKDIPIGVYLQVNPNPVNWTMKNHYNTV